MEEATIRYANTLSKEHKDRFIEYLKLYNSKDMEEFIERRKKLGVKNVQAASSSFQSFLMRILPTESALEKLESDSQSHST
jgi:hypothetical protein